MVLLFNFKKTEGGSGKGVTFSIHSEMDLICKVNDAKCEVYDLINSQYHHLSQVPPSSSLLSSSLPPSIEPLPNHS
jgi:hypothetical protein